MRQLPRESAYKQAVGGDLARWGTVEHLLANVADLLILHDWHYVTVHSKRKPPQPSLTPRPGIEPVNENRHTYGAGTSLTVAEFRAIVDAAAARSAAAAGDD